MAKRTTTLSDCAGRLDELTGLIEAQLRPRDSTLGRYEADSAALALTYLVVSYARSLSALAHAAVRHYPAAAVIARTSLETAATVGWLMVPTDPFKREGRWLGYYKAHERAYRKIADGVQAISPGLAEDLRTSASRFEAWRTAILKKLPRGGVTDRPSLPDMLRELGHGDLYLVYRSLSQVVHAEPDALRLTRDVTHERADPSGVEPIFEASSQTLAFGSFWTGSSWAAPLRAICWSLVMSSVSVLTRMEARPFSRLALKRGESRLLRFADFLV